MTIDKGIADAEKWVKIKEFVRGIARQTRAKSDRFASILKEECLK